MHVNGTDVKATPPTRARKPRAAPLPSIFNASPPCDVTRGEEANGIPYGPCAVTSAV